MRYLVLFLMLISCTTNKPRGQLTKAAEETSYYTNFDFINFAPLDKIDQPYYLPFIKVSSDSTGIKRVEVYWNNTKSPIKTYNRIRFKGLKAYESTSKFLACTTVDTLIALNDQLYEFRDCYSPSSKKVNEQDVFIYKKSGKDTVNLEEFRLANLYRDAAGQLLADTGIIVIPTEHKIYSFSAERYAIVRQGANIRILCKTKNSPWCSNGYQDEQTYPYLGCFYWSLFNHPAWRILSK